MKKLLALVLALVMTLSLCVVSSNAAYDGETFDYKEAVDVMSAVGVFQGDESGKFNPDGILTREQAAKIVTYMLLGKKAADALVTIAAPFADVAADRWSAGSIAYCYNEGILAGVGNGMFAPTSELTGLAFAKMMLTALGYDAEQEGLTGANWSINAAKMALTLDLTKGMDDVSLSAPMTREQAAQMAFNTEKATLVKYDNKSTITAGDVTIKTISKAEKVAAGSGDHYKDTDNDTYVQFCEKYASKLTYDGTGETDEFGRPAHDWKYDKKAVGTYADKPFLTYTDKVKANVLADDLDDAGYDLPTSTATVDMYQNGMKVKDISVSEITAAIAAKTELGGKGVAIELFANDNDVWNCVVVTANYLGKIDSVGKDKTSTKAIDERSLSITFGGYTFVARYEDDTIGFDEVYDNVKKGDFVSFVPYNNFNDTTDKVVEIAIPESVTGPLTYSSSSAATVAGTKYTLAKTAQGAPYALSSDDVTLYLDEYGYALGCDASQATNDKAIAVTKVYKALEDGELVDMVKGVTSDGVTVDWKWEGTEPSKNNIYTYGDTDDNGIKELTAAVATTATADGALVKVDTTAALTTATKSVKTYNNVKSYYASDVKFIFVDDGKAVVKEGAQKVGEGTTAWATIKTTDGVNYVTAVYVKAAASSTSTTSDEIVYLKSTDGSVQVTVNGKDKDYTVYKAYINGDKTDNVYGAPVTVDRFYSIEIEDDSGAYVLTNNEYTATTGDLARLYTQAVTSVVNNVMTIGTTDYDLSTAVIVDTTSNGNDVDSAALLKDALKAGAVTVSFLYDADDNTVSYLYVTDYTAWVA